jgi:hypothetical protein
MNYKSILHVSIDNEMYRSAGITNGFKDHFETVDEWPWQKVRFNCGLEDMRRRLIGKVMMTKPDVTFLHVQNIDVLDENTLRALSDMSYVVWYTFDITKEVWQLPLVPFVDLMLFGDADSIFECRRKGFRYAEYLQSAADYDLYKPINVKCPCTCHDNEEEIHIIPCCNNGMMFKKHRQQYLRAEKGYPEVLFIGNNMVGTNHDFPEAYARLRMVEYLQEKFGDRFRAYGIGWSNGAGMLNPKEEIEAYNACSVAITHNHFQVRGYQSDRIWRALGCGAFVIDNYHEAYDELDFPLGMIPFWKTNPEIYDLCEFFMSDAGDKHQKILSNEQQKVLKAEHTWSKRVKTLISYIDKHPKHARPEF